MSGATNVPLDWRYRWEKLIGQIRRVQTEEESEHLVHFLSRPTAPYVLAFANAHAMNSLATSGDFFEALHAADLVLRDGSGMATLYKLLHMQPGLNLNGTDLIPRLISRFDGRSIALMGTRDPYLHACRDTVSRTLAPHSELVSAHGFLQTSEYVALAARHRPSLIVLGMGMPRQEQVAAALRAALPFPCLIVCGGAIIDFLGGKTPRAPAWMRKTGLEWVFRLAMEPRRLFQRYVIGNPLFLSRALRVASAAGSRC